MKQSAKDKLPQWYIEDKSKKSELTLSNDLDSLWSMSLLQQINPNWKFRYFYDFEKGIFDSKSEKANNIICVDLAVDHKQHKTFDNHVSVYGSTDRYNLNSINLNNAFKISSSNYCQKYCGSTILMLYSLFDIPLPKSEPGKMALLAIDSTHKSYYNPLAKRHQDWVEIHRKWMCEVLGFEELYWLEQNKTADDFKPFEVLNSFKINAEQVDGSSIHKLTGKIPYKVDLEKHIGLSLDLPKCNLILKRELKAMDGNYQYKSQIAKQEILVSFALTGKNHCNYSVAEY